MKNKSKSQNKPKQNLSDSNQVWNDCLNILSLAAWNIFFFLM